MASIPRQESDTASASSDVSQFQFQSQSQSQSWIPPSPSSLPSPLPPAQHSSSYSQAQQHIRSQTLDNAITTAAPPGAAAASLPFRFSGPIKRKPVSSSASLLVAPHLFQGSSPLAQTAITTGAAAATSTTSTTTITRVTTVDLPRPEQRFSRPPSIDSPTLYDYPPNSIASRLSEPEATSSDDESVTASPNDSPDSAPATAETELSDVLSEYDDLISELTPDATPDAASVKALDESSDITSDVESIYDDNPNPNQSPPMLASKHTPPHLRLEKVDNSMIDDGPRTHIDDSPQSIALAASPQLNPQLNKPLPKSPGQTSPLASLFGWSNGSPSATEFSSIPSPLSPAKKGLANDAQPSANGSLSEGTKPDAPTNPIQYCESFLSTPPPGTSAASALVDEMEEELRAISAELAVSIRREMDLEDLVDRLQEQINNPHAPGKRTSDYFSDSGYSSAKASDYDQSRDEIERIQRKSEQEKASLRLELTSKLQDERTKRKELDQKIKELMEKASEVDLAEMNNMDAGWRIKELENTCEELRRKLSEERESKTNFEDLLSALKGELRDACNERDNLRDEVVPELRARVEGLEAEAAEYANLTYESSRMQQELQSLKKENSSLRNSMTGGIEDLPKRMSMGLSRSNSVAAGSFRSQKPPGFPLVRSDSFKNAAQTDSREGLLERLKDVEAQRDALHSALKSLLERQEFQNREHKKKIRILENERQRLLSNSPRKAGFEKDISKLRMEISTLRRRAEDALEQKWQVEKGLGGLKMDLDRAEEEIQSLRSLLKEKDILIPPSLARSSGYSETIREPVTSESLQIAYKELQDAYAESLERIKQLELNAESDEKTKLAVERLELSLSVALSERDAARKEADEHRAPHSEPVDDEVGNAAAEGALADELSQSADRIEQLTLQVQEQLAVNAELRERLSAAVTRRETDMKANSDRISELQERLRALEEQVVAAQTASEDRVVRHEEEITKLREAHNEQLLRLQDALGEGVKSSQKAQKPLLSSSATSVFGRSSNAIPVKSFEEEAEMTTLRARVAELEEALGDAETEMQEVVARMNMAQVEVLNLQEDREAAVRETRRLEGLLRHEQSKASRGLFATLSGRA